ncbi:hypothetical protein EYF80_021169 [Liparis tanakae]|uniref:Uncharacterized protein n=1 Tax=Liparis tanakae TaxID=230148 RepID=A0A4Z2HTL5_9TELE|nr:hypothetical protein EYF80_021169 [Liparis tanakae]
MPYGHALWTDAGVTLHLLSRPSRAATLIDSDPTPPLLLSVGSVVERSVGAVTSAAPVKPLNEEDFSQEPSIPQIPPV